MGTSEKSPPGSFEIPDLELEAPAPRPATPSAKPASFAFDDFELETAQSSLGIAMDADALPVSGQRLRSLAASAPWPSAVTPDPSEIQLEREEIERTADYGDPSVSWLLAPAYTFRVFKRRRALRQARERTRSELLACEARRDATLAELVRALKPELERREQFHGGLRELARAEQAAGEQERQLAQASAQAQHKLGEIGAKIAALKSEIEVQQGELQSRQRQHDDCTANLKRAEARARRVQIEIRGLRDVAVQRATAAGKADLAEVELTPEEAERLRQLEQQASSMNAEVAAARPPFAAAEQALAAVRRQIAELERQLDAAEQSKSAFTRQARQELSIKGQHASRAGSALSEAYAALGRAVLSGRGAVPVDDAMLERLRRHDQEVARAASADELHVRALSAYSHDKAKQGLLIVAGGIAALLVLLIYAAI